MERGHQPELGGERPPEVNSYDTDDPEIQARIEQARSEASDQRRRDRDRWERYIEAGANEEDASSLVEFEGILRAQVGPDRPNIEAADGHEQATIEDTRTDLTRMLELTQEPDGPAILADFARYLRQEAGDNATHMPTQPVAVERYRAIGLSNEDAATLAGFEYFLRGKLSTAGIPPDEASAEHHEVNKHYQPRIYVVDAADQRSGQWVDADQEPDELRTEIANVLGSSPNAQDPRWKIQASEAFAGVDVADATNIELVSQLARGVAEHGAAYAAFVQIAGTADRDLLDRFDDFYVGSFASPVAGPEKSGRTWSGTRIWIVWSTRCCDPIWRSTTPVSLATSARPGMSCRVSTVGHTSSCDEPCTGRPPPR
jgi:hypothetical protein